MEKKNMTYGLARLKYTEDEEEGTVISAEVIDAEEVTEKLREKFNTDLLLKDGYVAENDDPRIIILQETDKPDGDVAVIYQPAIPGDYGMTVPFVIRSPYTPADPYTPLDGEVLRLAAEFPMVMLPRTWDNGTYDAAKDALMTANASSAIVFNDDVPKETKDEAFNALMESYDRLRTAFANLDKFLTEKLPK